MKKYAGFNGLADANCLNACDTPIWPGGIVTYAPGTIIKVGTSVPMATQALPLYMWL